MRARSHLLVPLALVALPLVAACPGPSYPKPANLPDAAGFVAMVEAQQARARSFKHNSRMDYRVGDDRIKTTVLVMGEKGAKVRFNALDPTGVVAADLACDGVSYQFVDFQKNCQLSGPCTGQAIAQLLRVNLEPDDFLYLATGTTPLIPGATGSVKWSSKEGRAEVSLSSADKQKTQTIFFDGRDGNRWDVLESTVRDARGNVDWKLENKDFHAVTGAGGGSFRLAQRTRFEQPAAKGDLRVRWEKQEVNLDLPDAAWTIDVPAGLPTCQ